MRFGDLSHFDYCFHRRYGQRPPAARHQNRFYSGGAAVAGFDVTLLEIRHASAAAVHAKWKEVAVNAPLPGWSRFRPAQEWLDQNGSTLAGFDMPHEFDQFLSDDQVNSPSPPKPNDDLFQQFLEWRKKRADPR